VYDSLEQTLSANIEFEEKHLQTLFFTSVYFSILDFQAIKNQLEFFNFLVNNFFFLLL
jgi:hypothetical protein